MELPSRTFIEPQIDTLNPKEWRNVFLHYTHPANIFSILEFGIISKKIADRIGIPYTHQNSPKVQEAEGFEWISVWDSRKGVDALKPPIESKLTIIARQSLSKSKTPTTEDAFQEETIVYNRIPVRDFKAIWIGEEFYNLELGEFVNGLTTEYSIPWLTRLKQTDPFWKKWEVKHKDRVQKRLTKFYQQYWPQQIIDQLVDEQIGQHFIKIWLKRKFKCEVDNFSVGDVINLLEEELPFPIYVISNPYNKPKLIPIKEYRKEGNHPESGKVSFRMQKNDTFWFNPNKKF